jgi:PAS domain S-box-containing protein
MFPELKKAIAEVLEKGSIKNFEKSCYHKDGSIFTINMSITMMPDNEHLLISTKDVTLEKQNREQIEVLVAEQTSLLTLFDKGESVLFRWNNDEAWSIDYVSDNVEGIFGYTKEEFMSSKIVYANCIDPSDLEQVFFEVQEGQKSKDNFFNHKPYRIVTKSGEQKWVLDSTVLVKDEEGNITHYLGYISDFSEFMDTQERLSELNRQNEFFLESLGPNFVTYRHDLQGELIFVSQNFENVFGTPLESVINKNFATQIAWTQESLDLAFKTISDLATQSVEHAVIELEFRHPVTQERVYLSVNSHGMKSPGGVVVAIEGVVEDITVQKRLQNELQEINRDLEERVAHEVEERTKSAALFRQFIDASENQKLLLDSEYTYRLVNRAYCDFFGMEFGDFIGKKIYEINDEFKARFESSTKASYDRVLAGETLNFIVPYDYDDRTLYFDINMTPFRPNESVEGVMVISKNVTKEHNLELEREQQNQMLQHQAKLASMGEMIGAIAHQWRQPLNVISTGIQNLKYHYEDGEINEEFLDQYIDKSKKTIGFMSKTIDDFRSFYRTDKEKREFDLLEAVQAILDMQSSQLKNHDIEVEMVGESYQYVGIKSELQQVVLNLINNAKDVLLDNGIEDPKITISVNDGIITVSDNAGGIPCEIMDRVFEPYFTTKDEGKGTGMGLYMSKVIVEQNLGGNLSVSNDNSGAVFRVNLR